MKYAHWNDISERYQAELLWYERQNMLETRESVIKKFGKEKADEIWYTKLDYIHNYKYPEGYLFDICEYCGRPRQLMICVSDKPGSYQSRNCIYQCPCGKVHKINC